MRKKKTKEELKAYLFSHPLFARINEPWPNRDLDFEFEMMMEYHISGGCKCHPNGGMPVNIVAAWKNWIPYSQPDPKIIEAKRKIAEREEAIRNNVDPDKPISEAGQRQLEELRKKWGGIKKL